MRRIIWGLLLLFVFAIPWEYSLDLGEPLGNIARIVGLLLLLVALPALLDRGRLRTPGLIQWLVLAYFLWFCCSYFWTIEPQVTLDKLRSNFQQIMIVWLLWEFAESPRNLRALLRASIAGSWVLALLTLADFTSIQAVAEAQVRFTASGQDPNDVARFLDLGFPLAALLLTNERRWPWRLLAGGYLPLGLLAVLLTASRGGFLAALVSLGGSCILLVRGRPRRVAVGAMALPPILVALWFAVPRATLERLATISDQLHGGDLNQRLNIWIAGWHAFVRAPLCGTGAGTFVAAAGTSPIDTAHNTALSIAVNGGLIGLFFAAAIFFAAFWTTMQTRGPLRFSLSTGLTVLFVTSLVATVEESRPTWLLMALIALAGRLVHEEAEGMEDCFPANFTLRMTPSP